jgi:hypothetical protein
MEFVQFPSLSISIRPSDASRWDTFLLYKTEQDEGVESTFPWSGRIMMTVVVVVHYRYPLLHVVLPLDVTIMQSPGTFK